MSARGFICHILPELIFEVPTKSRFQPAAIAALAPRAPAPDRARIVDACLALEDVADRARSLIALGVALGLDGTALLASNAVFAAIEAAFVPYKMADLWQSLRALPVPLQRELFQFLTSHVPPFRDQPVLASTAAALAPHGPPDLPRRMLERALDSADPMLRLSCVGELARVAPDSILADLASAALEVDAAVAGQAGWVLIPLLARVTGSAFEGLWRISGFAVDSAFRERDDEICLDILATIAELCREDRLEIPEDPAGLWSSVVLRLATRGRSLVLRGTPCLLPLVTRTSGAGALEEAVSAVLDVGSAWP